MSEPASVSEVGARAPQVVPAGLVSDFEALYRAEVRAVMAFFARRSRDRQAVYDLTADTFVEAMRSFGSSAPAIGSERAWLFAIARRVYARHHERATRDRDAVVREIAQRSLDDDALEELIDRIDAEEAGRKMIERLACISPLEREATGAEEARADRAAQRFSKLRFRLPAARPRGRSLVALLASTGGLLGAAVAAFLLLTAGGAPSVAFAGWSASPTPAPAGQVAEAEASCLARAPEYLERAERVQKSALEYERGSTEAGVTGAALPRSSSLAAKRSSMLSTYEALPAFEAGEWPMVLTDTRGPYTSVIRESSDGQGILSCNSGPLRPGGSGSVSVEPPKSAMPAGEVRLTSEGGEWDTVAKEWLGEVEGRAGTGVTGVTVLLQDGTHVEATTTNGWFLAWWPGEQRAVSAEVTTASGVSIEKLQF